MTFARFWLWLNGGTFFLYGLVCLVWPSVPAGYAEMGITSATATTEVSAMYGGLQAAAGALLCWSAMRPERVEQGLVVMVFLLAGLAIGRSYGLATNAITSYNVGAVLYEATAAVLALVALRLIVPRSVSA